MVSFIQKQIPEAVPATAPAMAPAILLKIKLESSIFFRTRFSFDKTLERK
jgi:hypothetical protein